MATSVSFLNQNKLDQADRITEIFYRWMIQMKLTEIDALRAYARMMNTLDTSHIEPLLDEDFRYASQWMCGEIPSKQEFLDYMESMLDSVKQSGSRVYAEIAYANAWGHD